jgi:hypothetical protein
MDLKKLNVPLPIESVDFRVQSINKGGYATILAYKDARVDMNRLDEVVGCLNWKREHIVIDGSMYCRVSIYNQDTKEWIWKEDVGTESMADKEKGLASDSFKRACFNWGIGRELYDYPRIQIKLQKNEFEDKGGKIYPTYEFDLKSWVWSASFDVNNKLVSLSVVDAKGTVRFSWKLGTANVQPTQELKPFPAEQYETLAKAIVEGKTTLAEQKTKYTFSESAAKVINGHYKKLKEDGK